MPREVFVECVRVILKNGQGYYRTKSEFSPSVGEEAVGELCWLHDFIPSEETLTLLTQFVNDGLPVTHCFHKHVSNDSQHGFLETILGEPGCIFYFLFFHFITFLDIIFCIVYLSWARFASEGSISCMMFFA